ncbi:MAG: hypothetical protein GVY13_01500 [Alphaproteobacteria bacterium]|jgi:predicted DNA-binding protein|nr:hypothetical protein [Alphaproteobacteria bacterium]
MKAVASLTSSLMARKGTAAPAEQSVVPLKPSVFVKGKSRTADRAGDGPVRDCGDEPCRGRNDLRRAAKLTLRLEGDQHLQVKLLASHLNCSIQTIIREALQRHLDEMVPTYLHGKCSCLAELGLAQGKPDGAGSR